MQDIEFLSSHMELLMSHSKVCVITGASRGLGAILSKRFWEDGYSLHLIARSNESLEKIKRSLQERDNQKCWIYSCDLGSMQSINRLVNTLKSNCDGLDVLINNAAIQGPIGPLWKNDLDAWRHAIEVDLLAPVWLCSGLLPLMQKNGSGSIINLSGGGATGPRPNFSAYATSKAGLVRFSETLAVELLPFNIRVNCVAPGAMPTEMLSEVVSKGCETAGEMEFFLANKTLSEGMSTMQAVVDLTLFLASSKSAGITGKLISAKWDQWANWHEHAIELMSSDVYTLRRIVGGDRNMAWGDK